ncbi:hypothetical protein [Bacillus sp. FJAT-45037]|uniref:hypothetical protein n=1 Tax=Bacillus sp. FJAT-45037 TaxID=2011007 RepID=UPI000C23F07A|nr:hypothetical protein [Bacillus sp. FJAT-45037]
MIALLILIPLAAYVSMVAFKSLKWTVVNYENKRIPFSLGIFILFGYATFCGVVESEVYSFAFSNEALLFVGGIWVLGFIDDRYGSKETKGLRGHLFSVLKKKSPTTGFIKLIGTIGLALLFVFSLDIQSLAEGIRYFSLLVWMPHVMNLFDTRPLRVWKVTVAIFIPLLLSFPAPAFFLLIYGLAIVYLWYVLEGHRQAMLGDNGATAVGAVVAIMMIQFTPPQIQWVALFIAGGIIFVAEKVSFSAIINEFRILRWIDRIGVPFQQK